MLELRLLRPQIETRPSPRTISRKPVRPFRARVFFAATLATVVASAALAQNARFDLNGPKVEVRVTRGAMTLPIASVPNLQPGDRLWLHPDLPATQSVRYLMVLAFLRGTTNPPPENWFYRIETWDKKVRAEGVEITVPKDAEQAVLFLAPVTGGDFSTLRSAVRGRPGIFVRASQDLAAAGFEQARIEKYIASMQELTPEQEADPKQLQEHSNLLAATLALKPNGDCMKLPPDQQYTCLTQTGSQTLLDDGHGQSIIDALTGSTGAGLIGTASTTQLAGSGMYSAYVGTIVDFVHIMGSLHTAQYQYIPAIAFPQEQQLNLRLNTPPSFHNPKSVIVIGLPSVQKTVPPPLRASDPKHVSCLQQPRVVLPVEGAPLVFSTGFAHDLVLRINYPEGTKADAGKQDIPLTADAFRGGLVLASIPKRHALPNPAEVQLPTSPVDAGDSTKKTADTPAPASTTVGELTGTIEGFWGFEPFTGPTLPLQETPGKDWKIEGGEPLISGKDQQVVITSTGTGCIDNITLELPSGKPEKETWKPADKPNSIEVTLNVPAHDAGAQQLSIRQFGDPKPAKLSLVSYNLPAKLDALYFHAGDTTARLTGTSLDEVREVKFGGLEFKPAGEGTTPDLQPTGKSELLMTLPPDAKAPTLPAGKSLIAEVALEDGRVLKLPLKVEPARPSVSVIARADVPPASAQKNPFFIKFPNQSDLPVSDSLMFSLKSAQPFPREGAIEIASPDDSLHTKLSVDSGSLILEDPRTLLATLEPLKAFGPSAFGPVHVRAVAPDGTAGGWLPLVTLVRLPTITGISCPVAAPPVPTRAVKHLSAPPADNSSADASAVGTSSTSAPSNAAEAAPSATGASAAMGAGTNATPPEVAGSDTNASSGAVTAQPTASDATAKPTDTAAPANAVAPAPAACTLSGTGLYFIDSVANDQAFTNPTRVPEGFVGSSIPVSPPTGAQYYLKLRDDPSTVDTITLPAGPL